MVDHFGDFQKNSLNLKTANFSNPSRWLFSLSRKILHEIHKKFLIHTVHQTASTNRTDWRGLYFVPDARILAAELELAHSMHLANAPAREAALNHHVAALQRKLDAAEEENADWLAEVEQAQEIAEFYRNENIP